jgi:uncharacterized protein (DUF924 family)
VPENWSSTQGGRDRALLDFWFGAPGDTDRDLPRPIWFTADPAFDAALRQHFSEDQRHAASRQLDHWATAPDTCLALILLLDQLSRNLSRGSPDAYACDAQARSVARQAIARGFDRMMPSVRRWFFYLPFEHSEELADQEVSLVLFGALPSSPDNIDALCSARRHHEIIARFGRFPHRNRILGRISTAAELEFLKEPDSSF